MKSQYLSILPGSSEENSTANEPENSSGEVASYSARYQAFLYQQSQRNQRVYQQRGLDVLTGLVQGLVNLAIFFALFLGFLTMFGFGLSRLNGNFNVVQSNVSAVGKQEGASVAKPSHSPAHLKKRANSK